MAKAFKCDRCGELYEESEERTIPNSRLYVGKMGPFYNFETYDLCCACRAYLEVWWSAAYKSDNTTVKEDGNEQSLNDNL